MNSESDRRLRFVVKNWKYTERDCLLNLCLRGKGVEGHRSQMKQIKGEPWSPGETLAGHRDGIQMGDHGRVIQGVPGLSFSLSLPVFLFSFCLSHRLKFPKREASVGCPMSVPEASR